MKKFILTIIPLFLFLAACEAGANKYESQSEPSYTADKTAAQPENTGSGRGNGGGGGGQTENQSAVPTSQISLDQTANNQPQPTVTQRKIIRNADLRLEANSPEETQQKIAQIAESKSGFVIETNQTSSNVKTSTRDIVNMTIRVPADKFEEAVAEIRATGSRVIQENIKGQDVTEEFIDIEARLKTQRALEEQFLEIMKRATTVADTLNVQRELAEVRGEIEKIEGRKRFLENQSSLSTIKIQLQTPTSLSANPTGFFYELKEALSTGFNAALKVILFLITAVIALLPFLLLIVLPVFLILRHFWRKRIRRRTAERIVSEEIKVE
jgi:hypothetical protein